MKGIYRSLTLNNKKLYRVLLCFALFLMVVAVALIYLNLNSRVVTVSESGGIDSYSVEVTDRDKLKTIDEFIDSLKFLEDMQEETEDSVFYGRTDFLVTVETSDIITEYNISTDVIKTVTGKESGDLLSRGRYSYTAKYYRLLKDIYIDGGRNAAS